MKRLNCSGTNLEVSQPGGGVRSTLGLVGLLEQGSSSSSVTETVGHFLKRAKARREQKGQTIR